MFQLNCLGTPRLVSPSGDPIRFRTRKHLALLVYLAVEPSTHHRRERLAQMFWPRVALPEARHSLATALSVIRGNLGHRALDGDRDTIGLIPGCIATDVAQLASDQPVSPETIGCLGFLAEFEIDGSPDFAHWVDRERARVIPLMQRHISHWLDIARATGDLRRLWALGNQLQRLTPLSEVAASALLEAQAMSNDRLGALVSYDRWRDNLAEELGAVPSQSIERMANTLRQRDLVPLGQPPAQQRTATSAVHTQFVGRHDSFEQCYRAWQNVRHGNAQRLIIDGEDGIGKTALAERVLAVASLEGGHIAYTECYMMGRELPFNTLSTLITQLIGLAGSSATPPEALTILGEISQTVRQRWPHLPYSTPSDGNNLTLRLVDSVAALIAAVSDERPLVIVIDDVHLADTASLTAYYAVLNRIASSAFLSILTCESLTSSHRHLEDPCSVLLTDLRAISLSLAPLSPPESSELLDTLLGDTSDPGPTVRRAILTGGAGNPLALRLLVADWCDQGADSLAIATRAMLPAVRTKAAYSQRSLVADKVRYLTPDVRAVAQLCAVLGARLQDLSLFELVDLSPPKVIRAMAQLIEQQLLRDTGGHLTFVNDVVRGECYHSMSASLRQILHSLVADHILSHAGNALPSLQLEIAWHLVRAQRLEEAAPHLIAGGRNSIQKGAPHEAELALSTGYQILTGREQRVGALQLAEALQELGRWEESVRVLVVPASSFDQNEACLREVLVATAQRWMGDTTTDRLIASTSALLTHATHCHDSCVQARIAAALPYFLSHTCDAWGLQKLGQLLQDLADAPLSAYDLSHVLMARAWWHERQGDRPAAASALAHAGEIVVQEGIGSTIAVRIAIGDGILRSLEGQYTEAIPILTRAVVLAERVENPLHLASASVSLAIAFGRMGDTLSQVLWSGRAIRSLRPTDCSLIAIAATYERALGLALEGNKSEALAALATFDSRCHQASPRWALQAILLMRADVLAILGDTRRAYAAAKRALLISHDRPLHSDVTGIFARWATLNATRLGDPGRLLPTIFQQLDAGHTIHFKDRADLLASAAVLQEALGLNSSEVRLELARHLGANPTGIRNVLRRLGMLDANAVRATSAKSYGM